MSFDDVGRLLDRLAGDAWEQAWEDFLAEYSAFILETLGWLESDRDRIGDAYVHLCEGLRRDRCRRLRGFEPAGAARFATWLQVVVRRDYIDWRRRVDGRPRSFRSIDELSGLERAVFREVLERGRSWEESLGTLRISYPDLTRVRLAELVDGLWETLSARQRWILASRRTVVVPFERPSDGAPRVHDPPDGAPNLEALAEFSESTEQVLEALGRLAPAPRLVLQLRFQEELTLREIADLLGLSGPQAVARRLEAALAAIRRHLPYERQVET